MVDIDEQLVELCSNLDSVIKYCYQQEDCYAITKSELKIRTAFDPNTVEFKRKECHTGCFHKKDMDRPSGERFTIANLSDTSYQAHET